MPDATPFESLSRHAAVRRSRKADLLSVSRSIELSFHGEGASTIYVCLQHVDFLTEQTVRTYDHLVRHGSQVHVYGVDVRARTDLRDLFTLHDVSPRSPLAHEWNVLVLGSRVTTALAAREEAPLPGSTGGDGDRRFAFVTTTDTHDVRFAAAALSADAFVA